MNDIEPPDLRGHQHVLDFIHKKLRQAGATIGEADLSLADIDSLGIDSLELTELIMELEEQFKVTIDDATLSGGTTVAELASFIAHATGGEHGD